MDDRKRTFIAVAILIGGAAVVVFIIGLFLRSGSLISPVPEDPTVKIIFISPTIPRVPTIATPSSTLVPTKKKSAAAPTATKKPVTPTAKSTTPAPTKSVTSTPTVKASPTPTVKPTGSPTSTP